MTTAILEPIARDNHIRDAEATSFAYELFLNADSSVIESTRLDGAGFLLLFQLASATGRTETAINPTIKEFFRRRPITTALMAQLIGFLARGLD